MDQGKLSNPERYCHLIDKLNYLNINRPKMSSVVSVVSQYMSVSQLPHWEAILQIVKFLKAHPGWGFLYKINGHLQVETFAYLN